jgi:hypothetical protein
VPVQIACFEKELIYAQKYLYYSTNITLDLNSLIPPGTIAHWQAVLVGWREIFPSFPRRMPIQLPVI